MNRTTLIASMFGALAIAGAAIALPTAATAAETLPATVAHQLDGQNVEFTMSAAKQRRLYMMRSLNRQQRHSNRNRGYGRGYGNPPQYDRGYRPRPGYRPRAGYGYRRY